MTKHSVYKLMTFGFWQICTAVVLLHAALFMILPLLPYILSARMVMPVSDFAPLYFFMMAGMLLIGPFHAWLAETFKRLHVLVYSTLGMALVMAAFMSVKEMWQVYALALACGGCYGIALSAGVTISVDIITSERRNNANQIYASVVCVGFLLAALMVPWVFRLLSHEHMLLFSMVLLVISALTAGRVYVAFRAPIVDKVLSMDRFFLFRTWLPSIGVMFFGLSLGMGLSLVTTVHYYFIWLLLVVLLVGTPLLIMGFVNLSHHCQRATACLSYLQSLSLGTLAGLGLSTFYACVTCSQCMMFSALGLAVLGIPFSMLYYKRHKLR